MCSNNRTVNYVVALAIVVSLVLLGYFSVLGHISGAKDEAKAEVKNETEVNEQIVE
jgi:F0F1-type ATP synthase membrane subunit b/b'